MKNVRFTIALLVTFGLQNAFAKVWDCSKNNWPTVLISQEKSGWAIAAEDQEIAASEVINYDGKRIFLTANTRSGYGLVSIDTNKSFEIGGTVYYDAFIDINFFGFPGIRLDNAINYSCFVTKKNQGGF